MNGIMTLVLHSKEAGASGALTGTLTRFVDLGLLENSRGTAMPRVVLFWIPGLQPFEWYRTPHGDSGALEHRQELQVNTHQSREDRG